MLSREEVYSLIAGADSDEAATDAVYGALVEERDADNYQQYWDDQLRG